MKNLQYKMHNKNMLCGQKLNIFVQLQLTLFTEKYFPLNHKIQQIVYQLNKNFFTSKKLTKKAYTHIYVIYILYYTFIIDFNNKIFLLKQ